MKFVPFIGVQIHKVSHKMKHRATCPCVRMEHRARCLTHSDLGCNWTPIEGQKCYSLKSKKYDLFIDRNIELGFPVSEYVTQKKSPILFVWFTLNWYYLFVLQWPWLFVCLKLILTFFVCLTVLLTLFVCLTLILKLTMTIFDCF